MTSLVFKMNENHRRILGLPSKGYLDDKDIMKCYRKKINDSPNQIKKLSKPALVLMQSCKNSFTGMKFSEEVFYDMLGNAKVENDTLTMGIRGFRPLAHNGMLTVLKKKFGKVEGSFYDPDSCEIPLNCVQLPNDRTGLPHKFPPIKILVSSTIEGINFEIKGQSAILFVLFHMKPIIVQFLKQIPEPIEDCYSTPGAALKRKPFDKVNISTTTSSNSSDSHSDKVTQTGTSSSSTSSLPSPPPGRSNYSISVLSSQPLHSLQQSPPRKRSATPKSSPLAQKLPSPQPSHSPPPSPVFHADRRNTKRMMQAGAISTKHIIDHNSPVSTPEVAVVTSEDISPVLTIDVPMEDTCDDCTIIDFGTKIEAVISEHGFQLNRNCQEKCLEYSDSARFFIDQLWKFSCRSRLLDVDSLKQFKQNMNTVVQVLEKLPKGAPGFYCQILDFIGSISLPDQDRFMPLLSALIDDCLTDQFENVFSAERNARRNLSNYLSKTGSIFCFQEAIKILHRIHLKGVSLKKILPSFKNISELFCSHANVKNDVAYNCFIAHASREILENGVHQKNIDVFKVKRKMFKDREETLEIDGDKFLYLDKVNSLFHHFVLLDDGAFAEKIQFKDLQLLEDSLLSSPKWNFYLDCNARVIQGLGISQKQGPVVNIYEKEDKLDDYGGDSFIDNHGNTNDGDRDGGDNDDDYGDSDGQDNDCGDACDGESGESSDIRVAKLTMTIKAADLLQYWDAKPNKRRKFVAGMVGADWPRMYGSPCAVVVDKYNYVKVLGSQKRANKFGTVKGTCKMCSAIHVYEIDDNPFEESIAKDHLIVYKPVKDMEIKVAVTGRFELDKDNMPDVTKPKHDLEKSTGLHLKGKARELVANRATNIGTKSTYLEQLDFADENQIKFGNTTSVKSIPVIKQARLEHEKKYRGGKNYYEAALHVYESQVTDFSPNFEDTAISRKFPGFIRSLQQIPFKIVLSNFDQLKIGAAYLNKSKKSMIHMDSSGKFLKPKHGKKLLNTALVIPPPAPGHAPFPILELISESNKAIDFKMFIDLGWSYLSSAIGNEPVAPPRYAVTDMSFPNIHSLMGSFNNVKLPEYLQSCYSSFTRNENISYATIITVCENHLKPAFLKTARTSGTEKMIADTFVAGFMLVLEAKTISDALKIWNDIVLIFGSKQETNEVKKAMESIKSKSKTISDGTESCNDLFYDFDDESTKEEEVSYGNRSLLRENSPFQKLFKRPLDKLKKNQEEIIDVSNRFHAPSLLVLMSKQYLSLYPLLSASVLEDGLVTNTHVELYWKEQRRLIKGIPDRLLWPPFYLGNLHTSLRREAKNFLLHKRIPSLKYGGNMKPGQDIKFCDYFDESTSQRESNVFKPTPGKGQRKKRKADESFSGGQEEWNSQKKRSHKKTRYMKAKVLDFSAIGETLEESSKKFMNDPPKTITVTGTRKGLEDIPSAPQEIVLTSEDINFISTEHLYLTTDAVDAGLSLLDRRLNEESELDITVYTTQVCRLIFNGNHKFVKNGNFVTIIPRNFGIDEEGSRMNAMAAGQLQNDPGSHFTLVSNLNCRPGEINVYETFGPYRNQEALLTSNGKTLLKTLCNSESSKLKLNCINVQEQEESECGAIAVALAVNLCFYAPDEEAIFRKVVNVRKMFLDCMKNNRLNYFKMAQRKFVPEMSKVLFSINA